MANNSNSPSIILYGPPGCGKSTNAERIAQAFGLTRIVEEESLTRLPWRHRRLPPVGVLLISESRDFPLPFRKVSFEEAMQVVAEFETENGFFARAIKFIFGGREK